MMQARLLIACLDLTSLSGRETDAEIERLCARGLAPGSGLGPVAAVCIPSDSVELAHRFLEGTDVRVATVIAFPDGTAGRIERVRQITKAAYLGADEFDSVLSPDALGSPAHVAELLRAERLAAGDSTWKVIIETGRLGSAERIRVATRMALDAGADFVKTSTGTMEPGATVEATRAIGEEIVAAASGAGVKVSGGIREPAQAGALAEVVAEVLGPEALTPARFRIGASGLLDALVREAGAAAGTEA